MTEFYIDYEDMLRVTRANPHVTYRYTVSPSEQPPIKGLIPIAADLETIQAEILLGYNDGINAIKSYK